MKKAILSLITIIISLVLVFVFIIPFYTTIQSTKEDIIYLEEERDDLEELLSKTRQLETEYQQIKEEVQKIFLALPKEKDLPRLLVQFDALASTNGLLLENISFGQLSENKENLPGQPQGSDVVGEPVFSASPASEGGSSAFRSLPVNISVSGSYTDFKRYLDDIENNIRSMDVTSIGFTPGGSGEVDQLDFIKFSIQLNVYYQ